MQFLKSIFVNYLIFTKWMLILLFNVLFMGNTPGAWETNVCISTKSFLMWKFICLSIGLVWLVREWVHPADCLPTLSSWQGFSISVIFGAMQVESYHTSPKWETRLRGTQEFMPREGGRGSLPGRVCSSDVTVQVIQCRRYSGKGPHIF